MPRKEVKNWSVDWSALAQGSIQNTKWKFLISLAKKRRAPPVLEISLVLLPQILGPFGPTKTCFNFGMSIFLSEAELLNCSDISGDLDQNSYPIKYEYSIFALFLLLEFCLSPQVVWSPKLPLLLFFLVLPNVFSPPTMVAAILDFKNLERGVTHKNQDE